MTLYVLPLACGSPASKAFIDMSRRISFSLNTSTAALTRSSVDETSSMASSPFHAMLVSVPRKSKRVLSSWRPGSVRCRPLGGRPCLTMSNDESPLDPPSSLNRPVVSWVHPRCTLLVAPDRVAGSRVYPAGCPSGQWERTVNPSANAYTGSESCTCHQCQAHLSRWPDCFGSFARAVSLRSWERRTEDALLVERLVYSLLFADASGSMMPRAFCADLAGINVNFD